LPSPPVSSCFSPVVTVKSPFFPFFRRYPRFSVGDSIFNFYFSWSADFLISPSSFGSNCCPRVPSRVHPTRETTTTFPPPPPTFLSPRQTCPFSSCFPDEKADRVYSRRPDVSRLRRVARTIPPPFPNSSHPLPWWSHQPPPHPTREVVFLRPPRTLY